MTSFDAIKDYLKNVIDYRSDADLFVDHQLQSTVEAASANWELFVGSVSPATTFVAPSGDTTGVTDTANIKAAIAAIGPTDSSLPAPIIALYGHYYINETITLGGENLTCPRLVGPAWVQATASMYYMFRLIGKGNDRVPMVDRVSLYGKGLARGYWFDQNPYSFLLKDVLIFNTTGVGVDAPECWASHIDNVRFYFCRGHALRWFGINSGSLNRYTVVECYGANHADGGASTTALWQYEMDNGRAATMSYYGSNYVEYWPPTDEEIVPLRQAGGYLQTAEDQRGLIVIRGTRGDVTHGVVEANHSCEYPLFYFTSPNTDGFEGLYLEDNQCRNALLKVYGGTNNEAPVFSRIQHVTDETEPIAAFDLSDDTDGLVLRDSSIKDISTSLFRGLDGTHANVTVENVYTDAPEIFTVLGSAEVTARPKNVETGRAPGDWRTRQLNGELLIERYEESDGGTGTGTSLDWIIKAKVTAAGNLQLTGVVQENQSL